MEMQLLDGKYKILRTLGQGGMGRVFLAENIKLGTLWAIKEMQKSKGSGMDILVEANMLKKLEHSALPRIFDIFENDECVYIVVDYIEGVSLDKKLCEEGKFPEETVLDWARQLCDVLIYLHEFKPNPIIYRDMKPSNIILTASGKLKLIDFGIAREYKTYTDNDTVYIGTRGYAAPEQYGWGQTTVASDIYSLGVTLYHLVTGVSPNEPPYEIKPVRYFDKNLSEDVENIIQKCTKQDPKERYQSVRELLQEIIKTEEKLKSHNKNWSTDDDFNRNSGKLPTQNFKKLILTVWGNGEFGCELAYTAARLTNYKVLLIDLDLLVPSADLHLNVKKWTDKVTSEGVMNSSGLNIVMDAIERNFFTSEILEDAAAKRRELSNLFILTGNYRLDNYEYYNDASLIKLIEKSYQNFDITILLVNKSIYDSFTVISLIKSDFNLIPVKADIHSLREYNSYLVFLKEKQQLSPSKSRFIAFEYDRESNISESTLAAVTDGTSIGCIRKSKRRDKYRNLKAPYARRMEKEVLNDYISLLSKFNILPKASLTDKMAAIARLLVSRRLQNAGHNNSPQAYIK